MSMFAMYLQQAGGGLGGMQALFLPVVLIAVFYFILILPQQRRQKKWQQMLGQIKSGDKVVTSGGIRGTIFVVKDDTVQLRVPPDNLRLEVTRASIVTVVKEDEETKS